MWSIMLRFLSRKSSHLLTDLNVSASSSTSESPFRLMAARSVGISMSICGLRSVVTATSALTIPAKLRIIGMSESIAGTIEVRRSRRKLLTFIPMPNCRESTAEPL